jgi:hypothetical protein
LFFFFSIFYSALGMNGGVYGELSDERDGARRSTAAAAKRGGTIQF